MWEVKCSDIRDYESTSTNISAHPYVNEKWYTDKMDPEEIWYTSLVEEDKNTKPKEQMQND